MKENKSRKPSTNDERTVHCPVEGCSATPLARGAHLHIMRSDGDGHGEKGEIPDDIDLENLETAGTREVQMDYPERREIEKVARVCPYCEQPYHGKQGVLIHLGKVRGTKEHPESYPDDLNPDSFTMVHVDEHGNIEEVVEEGEFIPSTKQQRSESKDGGQLPERVTQYIETLEEEGKEEEAKRARRDLLP